MNEKQFELLSDIIAKTGMIALAGFAVKGVLIDDYYMVGKGIAAYLACSFGTIMLLK